MQQNNDRPWEGIMEELAQVGGSIDTKLHNLAMKARSGTDIRWELAEVLAQADALARHSPHDRDKKAAEDIRRVALRLMPPGDK